MAMAGLGSVDDIWHWPLHKYRAVQNAYLKILRADSGVKPEDEEDTIEIAPGVFRTERRSIEKDARVQGD